MSTRRLEEQYRAAVRWYPPRWRRRFGDSMVGVLLDVADSEGRHTPALGELVDLRRRALVEWLNSLVPEAVRTLVASLSTGALAAFSLVYCCFVTSPAGFDAAATSGRLPTFGPFLNASPLFIAPVLVMASAAFAGSRLLAHLVGVVALVGVLVAAHVRSATGNWNGPGSTTLAFVALTIIAANVGDPRRRRPALAAFGVVGVASALLGVTRLPNGRSWEHQFFGDGGWWTFVLSPWGLAEAGLLVLVAVVVLVLTRQRVWAAAIAATWLPWAAAATVTMRVLAGEAADALVVAFASITLAIVAVRRAHPRQDPAEVTER